MSRSYSEKLKDPRWQKKRLEILSRDEFTCFCCGDMTGTLYVHHHYYCKGREPWEYPNCALETLCGNCHKEEELNCRNDNGDYAMAEWEQALEWIFNGRSLGGSGMNGVWDIACQIAMTKEMGFESSRLIGVLLNAITDFRLSMKES